MLARLEDVSRLNVSIVELMVLARARAFFESAWFIKPRSPPPKEVAALLLEPFNPPTISKLECLLWREFSLFPSSDFTLLRRASPRLPSIPLFESAASISQGCFTTLIIWLVRRTQSFRLFRGRCSTLVTEETESFRGGNGGVLLAFATALSSEFIVDSTFNTLSRKRTYVSFVGLSCVRPSFATPHISLAHTHACNIGAGSPSIRQIASSNIPSLMSAVCNTWFKISIPASLEYSSPLPANPWPWNRNWDASSMKLLNACVSTNTAINFFILSGCACINFFFINFLAFWLLLWSFDGRGRNVR